MFINSKSQAELSLKLNFKKTILHLKLNIKEHGKNKEQEFQHLGDRKSQR